VWGVWGAWRCGRCGGVGSLLTFDIPQTALVATLDTYDFIKIAQPVQRMVGRGMAQKNVGCLVSWNYTKMCFKILYFPVFCSYYYDIR
jgi:hypothetical protein